MYPVFSGHDIRQLPMQYETFLLTNLRLHNLYIIFTQIIIQYILNTLLWIRANTNIDNATAYSIDKPCGIE